MSWSISDLFPPWGDSGERPSDNFQYDGQDQVNEKHFDYLWESVGTLEDEVRSALADIDSDSDGVVDEADTANRYKNNDIDSDGDGIVDEADTVIADAIGVSEIDLSISPTWTGVHAFDGGLNITNVGEEVEDHTNVSGTVDIDLSTANVHNIEANGNVTISFSNVTSSPPGNSITIYFEDADGNGPYSISWPSAVNWPNNGTIENEIQQNGNIEIGLLTDDGGTTWRARLTGENFA